MVFVTVSDTERYPMLMECIRSIRETNEKDLAHIAVFDLGLTSEQRDKINLLPLVQVYNIEPLNPYIFEKFKVRQNGRMARGWYSWKPIILKQALDLFPSILYLDASTKVKQSLQLFFNHINENGYLFVSSSSSLREMITQPIFKKFELEKLGDEVLDNFGLDAGLQGLTRAIYQSYVIPVYELARDIENFVDDGTAPQGFGYARHDQTLFTIFARQLNLEIKKRPNFSLKIKGKKIPVNINEYIALKELKKKRAMD